MNYAKGVVPFAFSVLVMVSSVFGAEWESAPSFSEPHHDATGLTFDGRVFAIGGYPLGTSGDHDTPVTFLVDGDSVWLEGPFAEGRIVRPCAGVDALGRIVVFGGVDGVDPEGDPGAGYIYDLVEGQSQTIADRSGNAPSDHVACATDSDGYIYAVGGGPGPEATGGSPNSATFERFDGNTDSWEVLAAMPVGVADAAAVYDNAGHILVFGGYNADATARRADVLQYDIVTDSWSSSAVSSMPQALSGHSAVLGADERVYVLGGEFGPIGAGTASSAVYVLDLSTMTWSAGPMMANPRHHFAATLGVDDFIYAVGGDNESGGTGAVEKLYTPPCPVMTSTPESRSIFVHQTAQLTASVVGGTPMAVHWQRDGVDLEDGPAPGGGTVSGAETSMLTITNVGDADSGDYTFVATNPCGTTFGSPAHLEVVAPPAIPANWEVTNLHPAWANSSRANAVVNGQQAGTCTMDVPDYNDIDRPTVWSGTAQSAVDMTPAGSVGGAVSAAAGDVQVGWWWWPYSCQIGGQWYTCYQSHAALWSGTAASHDNLHVSGWEYTYVRGTDGEYHVGSVSRDDEVGNYFTHAVLWRPPNNSALDLHPAGVSKSYAVAIDGDRQYGSILTPYPAPVSHAAMWRGSSSSFVDLHPAGASRSWIVAAADGQQIGVAEFGGVQHIGMWSGAASSFVDLNQGGTEVNSINGCAGGLQVGSGSPTGTTHAMILAGSTDSAFDLHPFLPADFTSSTATDLEIGEDGSMTVVGYGYNAATGRQEALMWTSSPGGPTTVPAVSTWGFVVLGLMLLVIATIVLPGRSPVEAH